MRRLRAVLAAALLALSLPAPGPPAAAPAPAAPAARGDAAVGFRSRERLIEHFRKHGRDFDAASPAAYLRLAQALRDRPAGGDVLEAVRGDGVIVRYDRSTGTFLAFDADGTLRTMFKPARGETYFRRQLGRAPARRHAGWR